MNISKRHKPANGLKPIDKQRISPPPLIPVAHLDEKLKNQSTITAMNLNMQRLEAKIAHILVESEKKQERQQTEIFELQTELSRLKAEIGLAQQSVQKIPVKNQQKVKYKCSDCQYSTFKSYHMKIHRKEGCAHANILKEFSCSVCKGKFTYNRLRYHLNQYSKRSSHARNGHENFTSQQHIEMLQTLKQQQH